MIIDLSGKTAIVTARRAASVRYCQGIGRGWRRGCVEWPNGEGCRHRQLPG